MILDLDASLKKKRGAAFFALDEDIDQEWVKEHQAFLVEEQRQKITKKFEKDNEKLAADGEREMKANELESRLQAAKDLEKKFNQENKTGKVEADGKGPTVERLDAAIAKIDQRIETMTVQAQDKEDNKEVALGTSKIVSIFLLSSSVSKQASNIIARITLTPVSLPSSPRGSTSPSRSSSPSHCERSSNGPSSLSTRIGSSKWYSTRIVKISKCILVFFVFV